MKNIISRTMNKLSAGLLCAALLLPVLLLPAMAQAAIQVQGTRFIYPAGEREITVNLNNTGNQPSLVQTWLDSGNPDSQPGAESLPFAILPPVTRVEARQGQALRIAYVGAGLPQDRESVFWLNVLDIPPEASNQKGQNILQFAFRSRFKLFFRPDGLQGRPEDAAKAVSWSLVPASGGYALKATNSSAYYVNFSRVELNTGGQRYIADAAQGMVAPGASQNFVLKGMTTAAARGSVEAQWINDFGASQSQDYSL
ncbi:fimbria/pilus periplasmic chaperone [Halomonas binhaiensis]|uniref:Fimbria/pilus periplasmic chaperone n=1 Tax=Halomonas binhaiensis TaxID=2562282 RepID=A0A5C1NCZ6_9GAMM|nr:fimbria/pilus periplasmic chaperone [Halomonas binhaiensis]QEM80328.1 fimbria/pilus periplasmic chaperone [Halomonas binhaiensis]